jgi:Ca2+-binding EF-hand superfamily protein
MKPILFSLLLLPIQPAFADMKESEQKESAPAEEPRRERGGPRPPKGERESWRQSDLDGDGRISREEFAQMPRISELPEDKRASLFDRLDSNGDGYLEGEELARFRRQGPGGPGGGPGQGGGAPPMGRLWELDLDKSGGISFEEFEQGEFFKKLPPERRREVFDRLDTDGDGEITPKDAQHPPQGRRGNRPGSPESSFRQADVDQDGRLSFEEFRKMPPMRDLDEDQQEDRFEALDSDGDGTLSPEEFSAFRPTGRPQGRQGGPAGEAKGDEK